MDSKSKLKALQKQNENIKEKLNELQIASNDDDEKKEHIIDIEALQKLKSQDSTPPPTIETNLYLSKHDLTNNTKDKPTLNDDADDDTDYTKNPDKYGYNPLLNMIKNKYLSKHNMTKEQYEQLIIKLAMEDEALKAKVGELNQTIDYLRKKQNIMQHQMVQQIHDNNIEYETQMKELAKNNWSGMKEFIDLNAKSKYPIPFEQRFALCTYYIAKQYENIKGHSFNESESKQKNQMRRIRNYLCHDDRSGDDASIRNWQTIINLMSAFPIIR